MTEISLSKLFNEQIDDPRLAKIEAVKITSSFKRVERMIDDMNLHGFDIEKMTIRIKIGNRAVVFQVMPLEKKSIAKKIIF